MWRVELLHGAMFLLLIYGVKAFGPAQSEPMCELNSRFDCNVCREGKGVCAVRGVTVSLLILYNQTHKSFDSPRNSLICSSLSPFLCFFFFFFFYVCLLSWCSVSCTIRWSRVEEEILWAKSSRCSTVWPLFTVSDTNTPSQKREGEKKKGTHQAAALWNSQHATWGEKSGKVCVCLWESEKCNYSIWAKVIVVSRLLDGYAGFVFVYFLFFVLTCIWDV